MRIVVIGGVAGGASAAARARRLSETAEIIVVERGPYVSFANCGLPYYVGGEIPSEAHLLVQTPERLHARLKLDVRINTEAIRIDRDRQVVVMRTSEGREYEERYDALILSPGAAAVHPPIPGIDRPGHFFVRTVPDALAIHAWASKRPKGSATVVGGGYIGLEMVEQLARRGMAVTLVEALPQVAAFVDPEIAAQVQKELRAHGVALHLSDGVARFEEPAPNEKADASTVVLASGARIPSDLVILAMGVKPEVSLARDAGLAIGTSGGIAVDEHLRTSDPHIWAVGDAIEVLHGVTRQPTLLPLAGPANRQGRIAAENALGGSATYKGTFGTGIMRVFGLTVAGTGANSRMLRAAGMPFKALHLHPGSHAGYYPGASSISIKVLYCPHTGRLLGAQAVGQEGVDKRIDVFATAIQAGLTVEEVAELELAYAPPFGSAKDPANLAGMAASNVRRGLVDAVLAEELDALDPAATMLLDVREPEEWFLGHIPGAVHIPLNDLRSRLEELPRDKHIVVYCASGLRSYYACRTLMQNGFRCSNLSGAYLTWSLLRGEGNSGS
jgi:NADPH-dependent 2,4-dienoyl-CoA reductase/sulfur reductase-like enzyme/rhodanese-related sulfurtransferase